MKEGEEGVPLTVAVRTTGEGDRDLVQRTARANKGERERMIVLFFSGYQE